MAMFARFWAYMAPAFWRACADTATVSEAAILPLLATRPLAVISTLPAEA